MSKNLQSNFYQRFYAQKLAFISFIILCGIIIITIPLELLSNDKPLIVIYKNQTYFPLFKQIIYGQQYTEDNFGGTLAGPIDYLDPYVQNSLINKNMLFSLNKYSHNTINYFNEYPNPSKPSTQNYLGTDDTGRDVLARLLYSIRLSLWFGIILALINLSIGILFGSMQAYFGGKIDLYTQRALEIWSSIPELYLLIIVSSVLSPNFIVLIILLSLFSWIGIADYIRLECLKIKTLDFIKAAKVVGLNDMQILYKHMIPNVMHAAITLFPFKVSQGILVLTALDFLGLGLPADTPSIGAMLSQAKYNLDAWWIYAPVLLTIITLILLLTFIGDGLRKAFAIK
jgi:microcin C transport system permease protein